MKKLSSINPQFDGIFSKAKTKVVPFVLIFTMSTFMMAFQIPEENYSVQTVPGPEKLEKIADSLSAIYLQKNLLPGLTVAMAKDGEILFSKGYGKADLELNVPSSPETVFRIGSITKQFTAAIILKFFEEGKLALDDTITKYLPEYPTQGNHVTIHHLLNHTSGIHSIRARMVDERTRQRYKMDLSDKEIIAQFADAPFDFAPGEGYRYNNSAYILLGQIITKISGEPYEDYVEHQLLSPLGLKNTGYDDEKEILPNRARGYELDEGVRINAPYIDMDIPGAAGALYSTTSDLIKWTNLLHSGQVITRESLKKMTAPTTYGEGKLTGYGYGLQLNALGSFKKIYHTGGINGFTSILSHYPEGKITIAVLTNTGGGKHIATMEELLARKVLNVKVLDLPVTLNESSRFSGLYTYKSGEKNIKINIFGREQQLIAQWGDEEPFRLLSQGNNTFIPEVDDDVKFIFTEDNLEIYEGPYEKTLAEKKK